MKKKVINIVQCDITELEVDAIVNAANTSLLGGGGVDGLIHQKAGEDLLKECITLNGCNIGEAKITKGYNLKAKYIIHTVAPQWFDHRITNKEELLKECYTNSYELAITHNIKTIAFPCLGMGVYQVPYDIGTKISIDVAKEYADKFDKVYLVCYKDEEYKCYKEYFEKFE